MPKKRVPARLRRMVIVRARELCEYCRSQAAFALQSFSVEHIIPSYKGGETTFENLALSCQGCNGHKHTKIAGYDPVSKTMVTLYHPRKQRWSDHFAWNDDGCLIIGLTPTGRATVEELKLNRSSVVNLRQVLVLVDAHPPPEI
jgi:5-methylcytosine-specific restriction endonuclease McrA